MMSVMKAPSNSKKPLSTFRGRLVLIGAGKMGGAMLDGVDVRNARPADIRGDAPNRPGG